MAFFFMGRSMVVNDSTDEAKKGNSNYLT
jgi:hypothetical protein